MSRINFLKVSYKFTVSVIFLPIGLKKKLIIFPVVWRIIINSFLHLASRFVTKVLSIFLPKRLYFFLKRIYRRIYPEFTEYDKYKRNINLKLKK